MLRKRLAYWLARSAILAAALSAVPAQATCVSVAALSTSLTCSATVSATSLSFGNYSAGTTSALTSTGTITVQVTFSGSLVTADYLSYTLSLSAGNSGSETSRYMSYGSYTLNYNLYTSSDYATVWASDSVPGTVTLELTVSTLTIATASTTHTIYGRIPASQYTAAPGSYTDTITVTVTY